MKKKISTMALVAVLATAAATTPVYASIQYPDINGHWSKNIVEKWAEANVVSGYPDGTFKPNDNITRAEFGVWVYKLFGYQPSSKDSKFADVNGHWAESIIDSLVEHGVIVNSEYGNNYGPDTKITRMEMIRMMVRAIEKQGETSGAVGATKFVDNASIAQKDTGFINVAAKYDIITGSRKNYLLKNRNRKKLKNRPPVAVAAVAALRYTLQRLILLWRLRPM